MFVFQCFNEEEFEEQESVITLLNVYINDEAKQTFENASILQACVSLKINIPYFCYHEQLSIAGNCRLCLVELPSAKNLVVSCANFVEEDMSIYTNNFRVMKARESVLEFLLIHHPLDCPICDQGGECDLQDLTLLYGLDRGRYNELLKRSVLEKNFGPFIKTNMTRCIHCTKCVRFLDEFTEDVELSIVGRSSFVEISTYIKNVIIHELSGNIIDLCPVGALTAKSYAFEYRN